MEKKSWKQILLPHLLIIGIFITLSFLYFSPAIEGKVLFQSDVMQGKGMAKEINDYHEKTGEWSLWTNSMFGGMPAYLIILKTPSNLITYVHKIFYGLLPIPASHLVLYMVGFYILMIVLGLNSWLALIGAIAYGFSTYNFIILEAGHITKALALGYFPTVIAGVILVFRKKYFLGGAVTALFGALEIYSSHVQITYYLFMVTLIMVLMELFWAIKEKMLPVFFKSVSTLLIAAIFAVLPNITELWITYEYGEVTMRGKSELSTDQNKTGGLDPEYAFKYSYGIAETFSLLVPDILGGSSTGELTTSSDFYKTMIEKGIAPAQAKDYIKRVPLYWGDQPGTSGPVYFGAIICFLFVLGIFIVKDRLKIALLIATVLAIMLSWGRNFEWLTMIFFNYFPMYNKFRVPGMMLTIAQFTFPVMAFLTMKSILSGATKKDELMKAGKKSLYIIGGLLIFFIVLGGAFFNFKNPDIDNQLPEWLRPALEKDRASIMRMDAIRSLVFILLGAGAIWAFVNEKIKSNYFYLALGFLILADMWTVNKRYLNNDNFVTKKNYENQYTPSQADLQILEDKDPDYRVLNLTSNTFNDAMTSYYHKSVGGYHAAKMKRYQDLIERHISHNNMSVLNMLNTRYVIVPSKDKKEQIVQRNPGALGNAWFVKGIKMVNNPDEEINSLAAFNPGDTAIVDKRFSDYLKNNFTPADSTSKILLTDYKPNHLTYQSNSSSEHLAVFSEIYYNDHKGWKAYLDGKPTEHIRANYVLRAMLVPEGEHKIEFKFEPRAYYAGEKIALMSSVILLLGFLFFIYREMKGKYF